MIRPARILEGAEHFEQLSFFIRFGKATEFRQICKLGVMAALGNRQGCMQVDQFLFDILGFLYDKAGGAGGVGIQLATLQAM